MNREIQHKQTTVLVKSILTVAVLVLFTFLGVYQLTPPEPKPADTPATEFSAGTAFKDLEVIAREPHPLHSKEKEKVRDYLMTQLESMGLEALLQKTSLKDDRNDREWHMENILTRLKGTQNTGAILVVAHYDSVPKAPGASDNGAAVASVLSSLRALKAMPTLKNDIIVLFSDGEEYGLLGAYKFAQEHPWFKEVSLVFNYEARGHKGPSLMFETSDQNGWAIANYAKAAPFPRAYSWAFEVYKHMPNNTDFTIFRRKGLTGLNFAFIGGWKYYHTPNDNLQNIDRRSLQHHGENMLPLLTHFGNLDLSETKEGNRVYFSFFDTLIHYNWGMALVFMLVAVFGFVGVLGWGIKKKHISPLRLLVGFLILLLAIVASALVLFLAGKMIGGKEPDYHAGYYGMAFAFISMGVFSLLYWLFFKRFSVENLFSGALIWFMILTLFSVFMAPGGSYMFTWPLLFGTLALALRFGFHKTETWGYTVLQWILLLPAFLILVPCVPLTVDALGVGFMFAVGSLLMVLLASTTLMQLKMILTQMKWRFPAFLFFAGILMLVVGK